MEALPSEIAAGDKCETDGWRRRDTPLSAAIKEGCSMFHNGKHHSCTNYAAVLEKQAGSWRSSTSPIVQNLPLQKAQAKTMRLGEFEARRTFSGGLLSRRSLIADRRDAQTSS